MNIKSLKTIYIQGKCLNSIHEFNIFTYEFNIFSCEYKAVIVFYITLLASLVETGSHTPHEPSVHKLPTNHFIRTFCTGNVA